MSVSDSNPFDPDLEGTPLLLTLDSRSLSQLQGRGAEEASFLISLCDTKEIEGLVTWALEGFAPNVPAAVMDTGRGIEESVTVRLRGETTGFIGGIPLFGQWERLANDYELTGNKRDRLLHYGPVLAFHRSSKRHLFVCEDPKLLSDRGKSPFKNIWKGVFSVRESLAMIGAALRPYGRIYEEADRGYSLGISNYTARTDLAAAALPNRRRIFHWLAQQDPRDERVQEMQALEQSLHLRATELLRAGDGVEREDFRLSQNHATADETLYHLRAAVAALAAACDSIATLSAIALELPEEEIANPLRVGFPQRDFRKTLKNNGGPQTCLAASQASPLFALIKSFRDPIVHQAGPSGSTVHHVGAAAFTQSQIAELSKEQVGAIKAVDGHNGAERWGLKIDGWQPSLAPLRFVRMLSLRGMALMDDLLAGLAGDLDLPEPTGPYPVEPRKLHRIRLLTGMDPRYDD
ncbi:MAG TPA: hypothetical protein VLL27_07410 [Solirubrobacterales bacterium]|nr:hypothetical protein [Solirubrobacterales bacterium]